MRIIAGEFKSRIIKPPKGLNVRTTLDKVREALFDILGEKVIGADFLDLFAGSGAVGIEALSRGAKSCVFVDISIRCTGVISDNLNSLRLLGLGKTQVLLMDAYYAIDKLKEKKARFDIVFIDPPYHKDIAKKALNYISDCAILSRYAFVVIEHFKKDKLPEQSGKLTLFKI